MRMTELNYFLWYYLELVETDLAHKTDLFCAFMFQLPSCVVFICPCVFVVLLWMICRASEQKHINVTEHLNGSFPRQLDLDLYLGVYAGEARRAHIAFCVLLRLWIRQPFIEQIHSSLAVAQGLQGSVYMCTWASAVQEDSSAFLALSCWIVLIFLLWLTASSPFQALYSQWYISIQDKEKIKLNWRNK